ncbi:MAG: hypothetical protein HGA87_06445 [Desulfobulbaceae bacterium]|nr:hypothetical protein [Desulfobulbaceae bacterium]
MPSLADSLRKDFGGLRKPGVTDMMGAVPFSSAERSGSVVAVLFRNPTEAGC